ncbi:MAG: NAD(P)-binding domain-containing protein, partial [Pseudonocardia sp.]|nr:NAD(P)-binding domain-containing protein [Pseudonocardia sp.]
MPARSSPGSGAEFPRLASGSLRVEAASRHLEDSVSEPVIPDLGTQTIGVLGGTGPQGKGLALRWAVAGLRVVIGSRSAERSEKVAAEL